MIRIAVVEDDDRTRALLREHLGRWAAERALEIEVATFTDGRELLRGFQPVHDIVLLDIQMQHVDGMTTARRIREVDRDAVLVFITSSPQFAVSGYEVSALSYLLKPVPFLTFAQELDRCVEQVRRRAREYLMLTSAGEHHRVDVAEVRYVESIKHRLVVHTTQREFHLTGSLRAMEEELVPRGFYRSNNCYLVNLQHVSAVRQTSCLLTGGIELQVSRPRRKGFLAALSDSIGGARA